jgi:predicted DNA-binding transcriptional regulator AlpA
MSDNQVLIDAKETMKLLKIGRTKLYELIKAGVLKPANQSPLKQRQRWIFNRAEVEDLLKSE